MWIKYLFLTLGGLCAGGIVAAGFFAFITVIGVITTYAQRTHTARHIMAYENALAAGAILGGAWWSLGFRLNFGGLNGFILIIYGLCYGIFVGSLIMALAETIKTIPIFFRRAKITMGLSTVIIAFAVGKCVGNLLYYFFDMAP